MNNFSWRKSQSFFCCSRSRVLFHSHRETNSNKDAACFTLDWKVANHKSAKIEYAGAGAQF